MTQSQIVQVLADGCEIPKKTAKGMMDHLAQTVISEVKKNGMFVIPGIGRLVRVDRKARMGRNPGKRSVSTVFRDGPSPFILGEWGQRETRRSCWANHDPNGDIARSRSGAKW